jgi:hypothetical protein
MATPTDQQQIRATLRRAAKNEGGGHAAQIALEGAALVTEPSYVVWLACHLWPDHAPQPAVPEATAVPPLMGAAEAADLLGMQATNLKRLSPPLLPVRDTEGNPVIISGRIPAYLRSDVMAAKERRDARDARKAARKAAA